MSTSKALAQNAALQIAGKATATILGVLTVAVLARYLGVEGYGQLTIILTFLSIFAVIVDFGLTLTTVQMISEKEANEEEILGNLMSLRIISAVLFLALAPVIALLFPYDDIIKMGIAIGAVSYLFGSTAQMMIGVFQKRLMMGRAVTAELLNRSLVFLGALFAPFFGLSLVGILMIFVVGNALQLLTILIFTSKLVKVGLKFNSKVWKTILIRSWPIGASIFFNLIYLRGDILFLSLYRSEAEIGIYGAAYKVVDVITVVPVMYMGLILPILIVKWSAKSKIDFNKFMQDTFDFMSVLALPFAFGAIAVGVPVMELIAGKEFSEAGLVLAVLGPAAAIVFFGAFFGHTIVAINKQKPMVWGYFAVAVLTVIGYMVFIPTHGIWAAAWMTLAAEVLITIVTAIVVIKVSKFKPKLLMLSRATLASLIMFGVLMLTPGLGAIIDVLLGVIVYGIALTALGGPKPRDIVKLFAPEKAPISLP